MCSYRDQLKLQLFTLFEDFSSAQKVFSTSLSHSQFFPLFNFQDTTAKNIYVFCVSSFHYLTSFDFCFRRTMKTTFSPSSSLPFRFVWMLVGSSGLEPPTSRLSGVRSNHLSYEPIVFRSAAVLAFPSPLVEMRRFELLTPCVQSRCSPS